MSCAQDWKKLRMISVVIGSVVAGAVTLDFPFSFSGRNSLR
jgi:hypothetical protein